MKKKRLITAALPYVNNVPHLGNLIQVLSADCFSRYSKINNYDVLYVCGTDEYGTATETTAYKLKITPQELCDKYYKIHEEIYEWFDIGFSYFGRTSTHKHTDITQQIFLDIYNNGYIVEKESMQHYSETADMFLADRYLVGTCPYCGYEKARGDQCDNCSKLLKPEELKNAVSSLDGSPVVLRNTKHLYLNLPKLTDKLKAFIDERSVKNKWSMNAINTTNGWLKEGLDLRPISRDLKWGTPIPLQGWEKKVFYVWFDAPIGYISITANLTEHWRDWWLSPVDTNLYHFIGKDNITFHTVIFPASMLATGRDWTMLYKMSSSEYLNYDGGKFSKSENRGIFGDDAMNSGIDKDMWRFYLYYNRPENSDYNFTLRDFFDKVSAHLVGNYANLVNRTLTFYDNFLQGSEIKPVFKDPLLSALKEKVAKIEEMMEDIQERDSLKEILLISDIGNKMFQETKPWELVKQDREATAEVISTLIYIIKDVTILLYPYVPATASKVFSMLSLKEEDINFRNLLNFNMPIKIHNVVKLFNKLELKDVEALEEKYRGKEQTKKAPVSENKDTSDDGKPFFERVDLVCAKVLEVVKHPDADKLYVLKLADGTPDGRQIVSGLVGFYKEEELLNKTIVVVGNLKPAKLKGIKSDGMLLASSDDSKEEKSVEVIFTDGQPGDRLSDNPNAISVKTSSITKKIDIDGFKSFKLKTVGNTMTADGKEVYLNGKKITLNTKSGDIG